MTSAQETRATQSAVSPMPPAKKKFDLAYALRSNAVPLFFLVICVIGAYYSGLSLPFLLNEIVVRMARNSFLVISLIIPILAGMGLNFGIVLGAMAGQFAYFATVNWQITGLLGFLLTCLLSFPLAIFFGWLTGKLFNSAKGKEMITGIILGFFANGVYQLINLYFMGNLIPIRVPEMLIPGGYGLRNTVDLKIMHYALDNLWKVRIPLPGSVTPIVVPVVTIAVIALLCVGMHFLFKTKLGQEFRATGQNRHIAEVSGIQVDKIRILAIIFSTVLAAWGQIIFLQNIGNMNTYGAHVQVGTFAVAAILIGGASVSKATIGQALMGTLLFHTMFIVSPLAGKNLLGNVQVGEYFRVFVTYGVIGVALALHAWQGKAKRKV